MLEALVPVRAALAQVQVERVPAEPVPELAERTPDPLRRAMRIIGS